MNNIPKVFVIVACRGSERYYKGRDSIEKCEDGDGLPDVNFLGAGAIAPYIFSYSTLEGNVRSIYMKLIVNRLSSRPRFLSKFRKWNIFCTSAL